MTNFVFRDIKPIYIITPAGDIINTESGEYVFIDPTTFSVKLLNSDDSYSRVKATTIFAKYILGGRSRINKKLAVEFFERKFKQ